VSRYIRKACLFEQLARVLAEHRDSFARQWRTGGRVRIVSPPSVSILMTSAPMSASIRAQWGPAMMVEKIQDPQAGRCLCRLPLMLICWLHPSPSPGTTLVLAC
jgi:hypothetical protein